MKQNYENADTENLKTYLREIGRVPLLKRAQEGQLARRIRHGDSRARTQMIESNLRLVVKISHDYDGLGLPLADLISEGNIGLMKAVERFDPRKGAKLSTYAAWWIKQCIRRALANQSKTIRLPVHVVDNIRKMKTANNKLTDKLGRQPTDFELADAIGARPTKVAQWRRLGIRPASLDMAVDGEDSRLGDLIADESMPTAYQVVRDRSALTQMRKFLPKLPPRERTILVERFGLDGEPPRTLEEVGQHFHLTRERIRQLQNVGLTTLREMIESGGNGSNHEPNGNGNNGKS